MKKLASFAKVTLLVAFLAVFGFTAFPAAVEATEIWVICFPGPSDCGITQDPDSGLYTTWEIDTIIIFLD